MDTVKVFEDVRCDYIDESDMFWRVDAWFPESEEGMVIAYIDELTGRVLYNRPEARYDTLAQETINEKVAEITARLSKEAVESAVTKLEPCVVPSALGCTTRDSDSRRV